MGILRKEEEKYGLSFIWPYIGIVKETYEAIRGNIYHGGIDINDIPEGYSGDPIYASETGIVKKLFYNEHWHGNSVFLEHQGSNNNSNNSKVYIYTRYSHLSRIAVSEKDKINKGQQIGNMGDTGNTGERYTGGSPWPHLHFEIHILKEGSNQIDTPTDSSRDYVFNYLENSLADDMIKYSKGLPPWKFEVYNNKLYTSFPFDSSSNQIANFVNVYSNLLTDKIKINDLTHFGFLGMSKKPFNNDFTLDEFGNKYNYKKIVGTKATSWIYIKDISLELNSTNNTFTITPSPNPLYKKKYNFNYNPIFHLGEDYKAFVPYEILSKDGGKSNISNFICDNLFIKTKNKYSKYYYEKDGEKIFLNDDVNYISFDLLAKELGIINESQTIQVYKKSENIISYIASRYPMEIRFFNSKANIIYFTNSKNELYYTTDYIFYPYENNKISIDEIINIDCRNQTRSGEKESSEKKAADEAIVKNDFLYYKPFSSYYEEPKKFKSIYYLPLTLLELLGLDKNLLEIAWICSFSHSTDEDQKKIILGKNKDFWGKKCLSLDSYLSITGYKFYEWKDKNGVQGNGIDMPKYVMTKTSSQKSNVRDADLVKTYELVNSIENTRLDNDATRRNGIDPIAIPNSAPLIETTPPLTFSTTSPDYLDIAIAEFGDTDDSIMGDVLESIGEDGGDGRFACVSDLPMALQQATRELISSLGAEEFINTQRLI